MLSSTASFFAMVAAKPASSFTVPASRASRARFIARSALMPMNTAARPTRLWKPATSSGIWVICTRVATTQPAAPPARIITSTTP